MADPRDADPQETREWLDALHSVLETQGIDRAHALIEKLIDELRRSGGHLPYKATTAYLNTIRKSDEERMPGELPDLAPDLFPDLVPVFWGGALEARRVRVLVAIDLRGLVSEAEHNTRNRG